MNCDKTKKAVQNVQRERRKEDASPPRHAPENFIEAHLFARECLSSSLCFSSLSFLCSLPLFSSLAQFFFSLSLSVSLLSLPD
mmetsp:Transcript_15072/g.30541  ORF Transcript_15072/g.30541 Transcript_15072/m.30541 type:complete len:83 (+) Transcript_15072:621-869(+)